MQSRPPVKSKNRFLTGCLITFAVLFLLVLIGGGIFAFLNRDRVLGEVMNVRVTLPPSGSLAQTNIPQQVSAQSTFTGGVTRLELYADGALIGLQQSSQPGGNNPLALEAAWTPLTSGRHLLMARGYRADNVTEDSDVVIVDVVDGLNDSGVIDVDATHPGSTTAPSLEQIAEAAGVTVATLLEHNPHLTGTDPAAPLPPDVHVTLPPPPPSTPGTGPGGTGPGGTGPGGTGPGGTGPGSTGPGGTGPGGTGPGGTLPGAPTAPRLHTLDNSACTSATLAWDDSTDEERYLIYRLAPGESRFLAYQSLSANTITWTDTTIRLPGYYAYQVAAIRGTLETRSSAAGFTTTPVCSARLSPPSTTDLALTLASVTTNETYDGIYCYYAIDGGSFNRAPTSDSEVLHAGSGGRTYPGSSFPERGRSILSGHPETSPVTLRMECRARRADRSLPLGIVTISHPRTDWDGTLRNAASDSGGLSLNYCIGSPSTPCGTTLVYLGGLYLPWETILQIPKPTNLHVQNGIDACDDLLPDRSAAGACVLAGIFSGGFPTLYWDWTGNAFYPDSSMTGYRVRYYLVDPAAGGARGDWFLQSYVNDISHKRRLAYTPRSLPCGWSVAYTVAARRGAQYSEESDPVTISMPRCLSEARVNVSFDRLDVGMIDDQGEWCIICPARDTDLEVTGSIGVAGGALTGTWYKGWSRTGSGGGYPVVEEGTYNYPGMWLADSQGPLRYARRQNNNVFSVPITDARQGIHVYVFYNDQNTRWGGAAESTYDRWCHASIDLAPRTMENWARLNQSFHLTDPHGNEANCDVYGTLRGEPVR